MNKRNFILKFALKTKYNFFACLVALLVLIFSVSSLTYAWIEGANALKINTSDTDPIKTVASTAKAVKVAQTLNGDSTPTLLLSQYIDPSKCSLAPAKGEIDANNNIVVKFLKDGKSKTDADAFRNADTDDISNNYIFFETKIKPNDDISSYKFKEGSSITINSNEAKSIKTEAKSIKTAVTVLDANRNPIESHIFTANQISTSQIACSALNKDTEYILQFRIWNDVTDVNYTPDNAGKDVAINFDLVPQAQFITLYLRDYTNNETNWKTLYGKTLKVETGNKVIVGEKTDGADYNTYQFNKVPSDEASLKSVKFVAYNSDNTVYATWDLSGKALTEQSIYCVYGGVKADKTGYGVMKTGETDPVKKVYLTDKSYENLMQNDKAVTLTSGSDSYVMYHASTDTNVFSAYTPVTSTSFIFNNGSYCVNDNMPNDTFFSTSASPTYYILGETVSKTDGKTNLAGIWRPASGSSDFHEITIKDRSVGRLVESLFETSGSSMFVSYPDTSYSTIKNVPYKAAFNSASKEWKIIATSSSYSQDGVLWTFSAVDNNGDKKFKWAVEPRDSDSDTTYTFKSAVAVPGESDGTWGTYEISNMNPYILYENAQKLVSFYGGVPTDWSLDARTLYIAKNDTTSGTNYVASSTILDTNPKINNTDYYGAMFTNVESFQYWLKHNVTKWGGKQIPEAAQGGAFYHIDSDYGYKVDKISGATTLGGSNADNKNSPLNLVKGEVALTTVTSSDKNMFGNTNLYIEYHMCPTGQENSANYYCLNPYVTSSSTGTQVNSSKTTTTSIDFTADSIAAFLNDNGSNYTVKTVLTDGTVYYVADVDYVKFGETKTLTVNKCANADIVVTKDSTQIAEIKADSADASVSASLFTGDEVVITATPKSSAAMFDWSVEAGSTSGTASPADNTTLATTSTYTINSIDADTTVSLTAEKYHKLTINKTENNTTGTVTIAGETATLGDAIYVKDNTTPILTATRDGSTPTRVQWETETPVDLTSTSNTSTYTLPNAVTADTEVNVTFTRLYKLTYALVKTNADAATLTAKVGDVSVESGTYYPAGTAVNFTATRPNDGNYYSVKFNRKDSSTGEYGSDTYCDNNLKNVSETYAYTITADNGDVTVTATVAKQAMREVTFTTPSNVSVVAGYAFHNATNISLDIANTCYVPVGADMTIKAKPYEDYTFTGYTVKNATASDPQKDDDGYYVSTIDVNSGADAISITANVYHNYLISVDQQTGATISVVKKDTTGSLIGKRVPKGTVITISIDLGNNYTLTALNINGTAVSDTPTGDPATYDLTVNEDTEISVTLVKTEPTTRTIYFKNTANWTDVKIYYYGGSNPMTDFNQKVAMNSLGDNLYSYDVPYDIDGVVFVGTVNSQTVQNDSSTEKPGTDNLFTCDAAMTNNRYKGTWSTYDPSGEVETNKVYFKNSKNWSSVYVYAYDSSNNKPLGDYPGVLMTNTGSDSIYLYDVPKTASNVIFSDGTQNTKSINLVVPGDSYVFTPMSKLSDNIRYDGAWLEYSKLNTTVVANLMGGTEEKDWSAGQPLYSSSDSNVGEIIVALDAGTTLEFSLKVSGTWYKNTGTITDSCTDWDFSKTEGQVNCKLSASTTANYKIIFNKNTKKLTVQKLS